jgi:hypothetical protein
MGSFSCWHPGQKLLWDLPILRRWQPILPWPVRTCDLSCRCSKSGDLGTSGMNWCVVPLLECSYLACHMSLVLISRYCLMCRRESKSPLEMCSSMKGAEFFFFRIFRQLILLISRSSGGRPASTPAASADTDV